MAKKERCSLCGREIELAYSLQKHGIQGHICGSCYDRKLKEIYDIKH
ncbi:MAG: hypothetical protein ACRD38_07395 [Nitrososphaerales archaeon]